MNSFWAIMMLLLWGVLLLLNVWVFQKSKARGNLLMLIGAGVQMLRYLIIVASTWPAGFVVYWLPMIGMVLFAGGFFLSVRPMVQAHLDQLKKKIQDVTADKGDDKPAPPDEGGGAS